VLPVSKVVGLLVWNIVHGRMTALFSPFLFADHSTVISVVVVMFGCFVNFFAIVVTKSRRGMSVCTHEVQDRGSCGHRNLEFESDMSMTRQSWRQQINGYFRIQEYAIEGR